MTRLVPRIPRRRRGVPDEPATGSPPEPGPTGTGGAEALGRPEPTTVLPAGATATAPPAEPPAATDPDAAERPSFKDRGRARRRLRYLRRVRELGFRDLGGLVFDQHRFGRRDEALVDAKVTALGHVDSELRALERALRDERPMMELREAGISACARCASLIPSDARFCATCGAPAHAVRRPLRARRTEAAEPSGPAPSGPSPTEVIAEGTAPEPDAEVHEGHDGHDRPDDHEPDHERDPGTVIAEPPHGDDQAAAGGPQPDATDDPALHTQPLEPVDTGSADQPTQAFDPASQEHEPAEDARSDHAEDPGRHDERQEGP